MICIGKKKDSTLDVECVQKSMRNCYKGGLLHPKDLVGIIQAESRKEMKMRYLALRKSCTVDWTNENVDSCTILVGNKIILL